jgi:hypothetical protein
MQHTVNQAPAAVRTMAGIITPPPPAESQAIDQAEQIAIIDRVQDAVGVCDPDPEHAGHPAARNPPAARHGSACR